MEPVPLEEKDPEYQYPSFFGRFSFSRTSSLSSIELIHRPELEYAVVQEQNMTDEILPEWLHMSDSVSKVSGEGREDMFSGEENLQRHSLRLLFGRCSFCVESGLRVPFSQPSFQIIEECLGLPGSFLALMSQKGGRAFKHTSRTKDGTDRTCFIFKIVMPLYSYYHLALSYNTTTKGTHGVLLYKDLRENIDPFTSIIERLRLTPGYMSHPLLLATLIIDIAVSSCAERIWGCGRTLSSLEELTGQHGYVNVPKGDPLQIDFGMTTQQLNFVARNLAAETLRLSWVQLALTEIAGYINGIANTDSQSLRRMEEDVACSMNASGAQILRADYMVKRKKALIQVVYQFMAHKNANVAIRLQEDISTLARASKEDSEVMRVIAIENKRDGTAMKMIAILGMFFLPGTFLATVFSMPVYNWDVNGAPMVKPGFKYYWAVTIPLTILVLMLWALAMTIRREPKTKLNKRGSG